jgi:intron-binding protein aquarius
MEFLTLVIAISGLVFLRMPPITMSSSSHSYPMSETANICQYGVSENENIQLRTLLTELDIFSDNPSDFSSLFRRILSMTLDTTLSPNIRTHLLSFIISAFQSLDSGIVRKECAPLVSISIWHNMSNERKRELKLDRSVQLRKAWRAAGKRYDAADEATKSRLRFERSWLYAMLLDFFNQLYSEKYKPGKLQSNQSTRAEF